MTHASQEWNCSGIVVGEIGVAAILDSFPIGAAKANLESCLPPRFSASRAGRVSRQRYRLVPDLLGLLQVSSCTVLADLALNYCRDMDDVSLVR